MPSDADADAQTAFANQRIDKCKDFSVRGLTPPGTEQKSIQALIESPKKLQTLVFNKDASLVLSAELLDLQQSGSRTSADFFDSGFMITDKLWGN